MTGNKAAVHTGILMLLISLFNTSLMAQGKPLQLAVIGLTHTHVHWVFDSEKKRKDFQVIAIVEPNQELAVRYARQHGFSMNKVFPDVPSMLQKYQPEAVAAFGSIYDHLEVVKTFAPLGIHIMVEKPLAVSLEHALEMEALARKHRVHLITNYETSWYPSNLRAWQLTRPDSAFHDIRKIVVNDGHKGPKKIGINKEFLDWLTDPVLNGGGALMDFGCYGANLATWLLDGKLPVSVTTLTHQLQKQNNPLVEDEAIILLGYDSLVAVIQASWNWPIGRKDMEIYSLEGVVMAENRHRLVTRRSTGYDSFQEEKNNLPELNPPYDDPFSYLAALVNGRIRLQPFEPGSLENNMIVMRILEAARQSAREHRTIFLQ